MGVALLEVLWVGSTEMVVVRMPQQVPPHRERSLMARHRWTTISFALAYAAVMLRIEETPMVTYGIPISHVHSIGSWTSWAPNLLFAWMPGRAAILSVARAG